ncbi:MAG TPA: cold shock domain-containing protein [Chitinophagaceae bacterium]|nr:cold shock domain-containing protein [Chitinophagaceae bacterium]
MASGSVKFYNEAKGFGFIIVDGTNQEIFVHVSALKATIRDNDRVTFDIGEGKKGPNAENVELE